MKAAVYFGSRELYADMIPASKSLLMHSDVERVYLLIEDDVFPYELGGKVETINISSVVPKYFDPNGPNYFSAWTYMGLIRGALSKVFPDLDTILSIDCDTIVDKDISELWDLPLDEYYYAAVKEPVLSMQTKIDYINAGVMLLNLKKLRDDKKDDEIIDILNTKKLWYVAQDALNICCHEKVLLIPSDYNACNYTDPADNKKIIHYAGVRGRWRNYDIVTHYREIPWETV